MFSLVNNSADSLDVMSINSKQKSKVSLVTNQD